MSHFGRTASVWAGDTMGRRLDEDFQNDMSVIARAQRFTSGWRRPVSSFLLVALVVLVAFAIQHLVRDVQYDDVADALAGTAPWRIVAAVGLTTVSFAALSFYDLSGLEYGGHRLPYRTVAVTSFCAYAIGNTAGFGPLSGGAVRYRFYTPLGLKPDEIARVVGFITVGFGIGLTATVALGLIGAAGAIASVIGVSSALLHLAGGVCALLVMVPMALSLKPGRRIRVGRVEVAFPNAGLLGRQLLITLIDVTASASVLWVLLPQTGIGLPAFVAIYSVAVGIGVLSHVPAGLGVFETVIVAALGGVAPLDQLLGALVLYRLVYHALPLAIAALLIVGFEARRALSASGAGQLVAAAGAMAPPVLATLSLLTGGMLILSGLTPAPPQRLETLSSFVPLPIVEGSHFLSSVLGTVIIVASRGLLFRLDGAWWVTVGAAALALAFAPLKALALGETIVLALLLGSLLLARREFHRPSTLLHETLSRRWSVAVATVLVAAVAIMFFAYKEVEYTRQLWWQFEFTGDAPRSLRALVGILLSTAFFAVWSLMRSPRGVSRRPSAEDMAHALAIVAKQEKPEANLVRMGDKSILFSDDGEAFIMFARSGRSWVALFDPVGNIASWPGLVWKFVEMARQHGGRAAFYEVGPEHLSLYADAGLYAFRLGESGKVNLTAFDLQGSRYANFRNVLRRGDKTGMTVEIVPRERTHLVLDELAAVSDRWLEHNKVREKGFSLGAFTRDYVQSQLVATLRLDGKLIAFATIMTTDIREVATLDLMRMVPDAPNGAMDFLFLKLIMLFRDEGYRWFELGMAPLAGFRRGGATTLWNRVGGAVFEHGERFYHFRGLYGFKNKFNPEWRPRYMVVFGGINPLIALADVAVLISGGIRGAIAK